MVRKGYQKKRNFALVSKRCITLVCNDGNKKIHIKTDILGTFLNTIFEQKSVLWEYFVGALLDAKIMHGFETSAKFSFF